MAAGKCLPEHPADPSEQDRAAIEQSGNERHSRPGGNPQVKGNQHSREAGTAAIALAMTSRSLAPMLPNMPRRRHSPMATIS